MRIRMSNENAEDNISWTSTSVVQQLGQMSSSFYLGNSLGVIGTSNVRSAIIFQYCIPVSMTAIQSFSLNSSDRFILERAPAADNNLYHHGSLYKGEAPSKPHTGSPPALWSRPHGGGCHSCCGVLCIPAHTQPCTGSVLSIPGVMYPRACVPLAWSCCMYVIFPIINYIYRNLYSHIYPLNHQNFLQ